MNPEGPSASGSSSLAGLSVNCVELRDAIAAEEPAALAELLYTLGVAVAAATRNAKEAAPDGSTSISGATTLSCVHWLAAEVARLGNGAAGTMQWPGEASSAVGDTLASGACYAQVSG